MAEIVDERQRLVERATIVAFLRKEAADRSLGSGRFYFNAIADQIENGDHLASPSEGNKMQNPHEDGNGPYRYQQEIDLLNGTVRPEGNKKGEPVDEFGQSMDPHKLKALLDGRDQFIVEAGLWGQFVDQLPRPESRPQGQPRKAWEASEAMVDAAVDTFNSIRGFPSFGEPINRLWMLNAVNAALALSVSPAAPEGWQTVPKEPTTAQTSAAELAAPPRPKGGTLPLMHAAMIYKAMLAAALPSPAAQEQEKGEQT